jgi:hypothetical protein
MKTYQESIYFNTWRMRFPDCQPIKIKLENAISIINIRFDDFYKIWSFVYHQNNPELSAYDLL